MAQKRFEGKVALVTGGASGIGDATARGFCAEGAAVVIADILDDKGAALAHDIGKSGGKAAYIHCDMQSEDDIRSAVKAAVDRFGGLHFAFNNAGIEGTPAPTTDCTNENWERVININLRGVWWCMKHEIPTIQASGGGAIVNCSSIAGVNGFAGIPAYAASKHGVIGLTKGAALELAETGIRVNAICPGVIATPMIDRFTGGDTSARKGLESNAPMKRMGRPEEIADAVLWLCSPGASYTTGHTMVVDGGWVAQ